jgi:hypothetical protein
MIQLCMGFTHVSGCKLMNTFGLLALSYSSEAPYFYTTRIIQENVSAISVSKIMHFFNFVTWVLSV